VLHKVVQVRLYPTKEQEIQLAQTFGCARWWWNYALNKSIWHRCDRYNRFGYYLQSCFNGVEN
jgi:transposase